MPRFASIPIWLCLAPFFGFWSSSAGTSGYSCAIGSLTRPSRRKILNHGKHGTTRKGDPNVFPFLCPSVLSVVITVLTIGAPRKRLKVSRTEGHGKAGLIRILCSVCVGEFRGWSLIPRDPRLDVAGRNRLSGFVRILVAAVIVCVPAPGTASPPMSRPRRHGIGFVLHKESRIHPTLTL